MNLAPRHLRIVSMTAALSGILTVFGTGCKDDSPSAGVDPAPVAGSFAPSDFVGLPKPAGAQPFADPVIDRSGVTQSFEVSGSTPEQILEFYDTQLAAAGWEPSVASAELGEGEWQGEWLHQDQTLQVSATPEDANGTASQLDLVLSTT